MILDLLVQGAVHLTTVRLLAPHLTAANYREVLDSARGKRKAEVEEIVARLSPRPDVPPSIRRLPTHRSDPVPRAAPFPAQAPPPSALCPAQPPPAAALPTPSLPVRPASVRPLSPDRYKYELTIDGETVEMVRLAKDMLGHAIPSGDDAAMLKRALKALLVDLAKQKFADTRRPRRSRGTTPGSRDIAAAVKRAVWLRDLGRCAFIGTNRHRCNERRFVEFHHYSAPRIIPRRPWIRVQHGGALASVGDGRGIITDSPGS